MSRRDGGTPVPHHPHAVGVLFDFDGTLADTIPLIVASYQHALAQADGAVVEEATIRPWIGRALRDTLEERHPGRGAELADRYREHNLAHHDTLIRPVPGAADLVAQLQRSGVPVAVVSSKKAETVRRGMRVTDLPEVEHVVGLDETAAHKPDPAPLLEGARRLGLPPQDCVYVGDAVVDVLAALAAGMRPVGVSWGAGDPAAMRDAGAEVVVDTVDELRQALAPLIARQARQRSR